MEDLEKLSCEYDGVSYVTFEMAKMKQANNFRQRPHPLRFQKREKPKESQTLKRIKSLVFQGFFFTALFEHNFLYYAKLDAFFKYRWHIYLYYNKIKIYLFI